MQPASTATVTGQTAASASGSDSSFVQMAGSGGMAEVRLGMLAQKKSSSAEVKQFGQRMVTDHSKANKDLIAAAQQAGLTPPSTLLPKHQRTASDLSTKTGSGFDKARMAEIGEGPHRRCGSLSRKPKAAGRSHSSRCRQDAAEVTGAPATAKEIATKVGADTTGMSAHAERESGTR